MKWQVVARSQAQDDILKAAEWYDSQRTGLGDEFIEEVLERTSTSLSTRAFRRTIPRPTGHGSVIW